MRLDERLTLNPEQWIKLTTLEKDFVATEDNAAAFFNAAKPGNITVIAVMKKNASRLRSLIAWLETLDSTTRSNLPFLIIDDEADQTKLV
jgi:prephenate dehydratase